ncbi:MAG: DUF3187 family protein [Spirochaetia bacterium]|nr:DUF3187 family protein [Spirochaetia bacterium]
MPGANNSAGYLHPAIRRFLALLAGSLLLTCPIGAYVDYPYAVNFQTIRSPLLPLGDEFEKTDSVNLRINLRWMNVWSYQRSQFLIDGEEVQLEPNLRWAISDTLQVGVSVPVVAHGGGALDSSIETFHKMVNVGQNYRNQYKRNTFNVSYEPLGRLYALSDDLTQYTARNFDYRTYPRKTNDPPSPLRTSPVPQAIDQRSRAFLEGNALEFLLASDQIYDLFPGIRTSSEVIPVSGGSSSGPGDPKLNLQKILFGNLPGNTALVGGFQFKLPAHTGTFLSTPGLDRGAFLTLQKQASPASPGFSAGWSYTAFSTRHFYSVRLPSKQWAFRAGFEVIVSSVKLITEYVYFSRPTIGMGHLSQDGHQVTLGLAWRQGRAENTIALIENMVHYGVTPDIGFVFSSELRL